jgi:RimJ/RimL family protein N-acetyltransferase
MLVSLLLLKMVYLSPASNSVFKKLILWIDSEEMLVQFSGIAFSFPLTMVQLEATLLIPKRLQFGVFATATQELIGYAEVFIHDDLATLGRLFIISEYRNLGYGGALVKLLIKYIQQNFPLSIIDLFVFNWNHQAIRCYKKMGFVTNESVFIERLVKGQKWIALQMIYSGDDLKNN